MSGRQSIDDRMSQINRMLVYRPDPVDLVKACGGYYECPKDDNGKRLGPLVGYAGRDSKGRRLVGDIYVNFATVERYGPALNYIASQLKEAIQKLPMQSMSQMIDGFCGAPEGGRALAATLSILMGRQHMFPEKKVTAVATEKSREESELVFSRHEPAEGEQWAIVEDVCNNFSTTAKLVELIEEHGARCVGIVCFLNRSPEVRETFKMKSALSGELQLPVISLVNKPYPQFEQDSPEVLTDIQAGNIVLKPKNEWPRLVAAMAGK